MLLIQQTLAFYIPCCLLVTIHRRVLADEDAVWDVAVTEKQPVENSMFSWFKPSMPKMPSLPSISFIDYLNPFGGGSKDEDDRAATTQLLTTSTPVTPAPFGPRGPPVSTGRIPARNDSDAVVSASYAPSGSPAGNEPLSTGSGRTGAPTEHATTQDTSATTEHIGGPAEPGPPEDPSTETAEVTGLPGEPSAASSTVAPETVPDARGRSPTATPDTADTINTVPLETTLGRRPQGSVTPSTARGTVPVTTSKTLTGGSAGESDEAGVRPSGTHAGQGFSATTEVKGRLTPESMPTTRSREVNPQLPGEIPGSEDQNGEEDDKDYVVARTRTKNTSSAEVSTATFKLPTTPDRLTTANATHIPLHTEAWTPQPADPSATLLPDCNANEENSGICNLSYTWSYTESRAFAPDTPHPASTTTTTSTAPATATGSTNQSHNPFHPLYPAMLVPLYADWNSAIATWGLAWNAHVYSTGCFFAAITLASALNLLCLPLRCPSGCGYFALVSLFLLAAGCTRSFSLLYDAYGHRGHLPSTEAYLVLQESLFPCLTAAFGLVFLLLSMRSRMQLSYSAFQRPFFLACLVVLHFVAAFGPATLLNLYRQNPSVRLFLCLVSRGAFVALATFLSAAYFVFYVYVRADSKHIYHLNNTSPTPAERYNRCPFAESRDWDRAAMTVCISALFCLACAGLQLYAMLNAMGVTGGEEVFHAWPWWTFQFSCRVCELGVCITLALVVAQPVYCSNSLPGAGSCWTELLAAKSPILPGTYHWSLNQQEKLAIVDTGLGLGETESLPLYTLVDERLGSSLNGLDLLYHSNRALAYRDLDLTGSEKPDGGAGGGASGRSSMTSDSTADLRPPSPIDLRRSIDEALFGESLFPMSLFSPTTPLCCSDLSLANLGQLPNGGQSLFGWDPLSADAGLYRTSSCTEVPSEPTSRSRGVTATTAPGAPPSPSLSTSTTCSSPERWRGSSSSCASYRPSFGGSSLVLCPSPAGRAIAQDEDTADRQAQSAGHQGSGDPQRRYQTLGSASQESLAMDLSSEADRSLQDEFISVCRQMDASSVCSETIDL